MVGVQRKQKTDLRPSGPVNIWALLESAVNDAPGVRPENSVTVEEFAARTGYACSHAARILRMNPALRPVPYKSENKRRSVCYVPV